LFASNGENFLIPDKIKEYVKINDFNELLINKKLLGFSESFNLEDEWYNTNDVVEKINEKEFKFKSRKTDMINVGGYKVNVLEVEELLMQIEGVLDVYVYGRKNSVTGNIIGADVVIENGYDEDKIKKYIKDYATKNLQKWKIPRIIKVIDKIEQTRTGKKVRK